MDKQNYTLRDIEKQALKSYYPRLKKDLAKELEAKLFKRKRVLKSVEQLLQGIYLYFAEQLSFQRVSDIMACQYDITMSDTAWRKQFLKAAPILYEAVERLLMQEEGVAPDMHNGVLGCESAYAIDATELTEQGGKTTEMRIHTLFSITGHKCTSSKITDQHVGESLTHFKLHKDALYFADRAYGKTPQLAYALEHQSNFVIRIAPHMVKFFTRPDCREKIMFPRLMQGTSFSTVGYFKRDKDKFYV